MVRERLLLRLRLSETGRKRLLTSSALHLLDELEELERVRSTAAALLDHVLRLLFLECVGLLLVADGRGFAEKPLGVGAVVDLSAASLDRTSCRQPLLADDVRPRSGGHAGGFWQPG